jgi:hypothetical protein
LLVEDGGLAKLLPVLTLNHDLPDLYLPDTWDNRHGSHAHPIFANFLFEFFKSSEEQ